MKKTRMGISVCTVSLLILAVTASSSMGQPNLGTGWEFGKDKNGDSRVNQGSTILLSGGNCMSPTSIEPSAGWEFGKDNDGDGKVDQGSIVELGAGNFVNTNAGNRLRVRVHNLPPGVTIRRIDCYEEDWAIWGDDNLGMWHVDTNNPGSSTWRYPPGNPSDPGSHCEIFAVVTLSNDTKLETGIIYIPHRTIESDKEIMIREYSTEIGGHVKRGIPSLHGKASVRGQVMEFKVVKTAGAYLDPKISFKLICYEMGPDGLVEISEEKLKALNGWDFWIEPESTTVGPPETVEVFLCIEPYAPGEMYFSIMSDCEGFIDQTDPLYVRIDMEQRNAILTGNDPPIYQNTVAFPTPESSIESDLNGDGETDDTILCYQDLETGELVNTGLIVSDAYHAIDIYENFIVFVGENSHICYYDICSKTVGEIGATGFHPSIYGDIIAFASEKTIHYFDIGTQTLIDTNLYGMNPTIYKDIIVFHAFPGPTIWTYDLRKGIATETGIIGKNPSIFEALIAFETSESSVLEDLNNDGDIDDSVISYCDLETHMVVNTGAVGSCSILHENRIVFATREQDVNRDLSGDGKILASVIQYYDLKTGHIVNTHMLGTEPDIYGDLITFYLWEHWISRDLNGDGDLDDPVVQIYHITLAETATLTAVLFEVI
jgi:hypothetical protein